MKHEPMQIKPLTEEEKAQIVENSILPKICLDVLADTFLAKNDLKKGWVLPAVNRTRLIATAVYAAALLLSVAYYALYHKSAFFAILATLVYAIVMLATLGRNRMRRSMIAEIVKRPDDPIDHILAAKAGTARRSGRTLLVCLAVLLCALAVSAGVFVKPHAIYEASGSGYALRYYTLSFSSEDAVVVPETYKGKPVVEIRGETFMNMDFSRITLPSGLTEIRGDTFSGCKNLTHVVLPEGVRRIGGGAFSGCERLSKVVIPETVIEIGGGAFLGCSSLRTIDLPSALTEIAGDTFSGCSLLKSVVIPAGVTRIGGGAFRDCRFIESVDLPGGLTEIHGDCFSGCTGLKRIVIPEGVTRIGGHAFFHCTSLSEVTVPSTVTEIGSSAFRECYALKSIRLPNGAYVNERAFKDSPTTIERY